MNLVEATRTKNAVTYNNALTNSTSLNKCVDLFFIAGASRTMPESDIISMFEGAYSENREIAVKILFWARDVRGGAGERRFFRIIWSHIKQNYPDVFKTLFKEVPEYGRWDDLFYNEDFLSEVSSYLKSNLDDRLLAKWLPRKGKMAALIRKEFGMKPKEYRKTLVRNSETVEQLMCAKEWKAIEYKKVPSVAMNKYRKAFLRNDESRFRMFLDEVEKGESKINADVLFPHKLYDAWQAREDKQAVEAQWNALPDYMEGDERILPVCDVSGSMTGLPMSVSVSLGVYISERNKSVFKDAFITFSGSPRMQYLKGDLYSRFHQLERADWQMNTNLQAVFDLVLTRAMQENVSENNMPTKILIISDMEFDQATGYNNRTNLEVIRNKYNQSGYKMPQIVFWNVNGRQGNVPATFTEQGIGLVSGFSPSILKGILSGKIVSPEKLMLDVVTSERYNPITLES